MHYPLDEPWMARTMGSSAVLCSKPIRQIILEYVHEIVLRALHSIYKFCENTALVQRTRCETNGAIVRVLWRNVFDESGVCHVIVRISSKKCDSLIPIYVCASN